jgi:hypothetical protein
MKAPLRFGKATHQTVYWLGNHAKQHKQQEADEEG